MQGLQTEVHGAHGETGALPASAYAHNFDLHLGGMGEHGGAGEHGQAGPGIVDHSPPMQAAHDFQPVDYSHAIAHAEPQHFALHG